MELPHLGQSCAQVECNKLDFLPYTCDLCSKVFCELHREYKYHSCPEQYRIDQKVPVCPKCDQIIPMKPGEDPNIKVNQHIENNCSKVPKVQTYPNRCSKRGCKKKEAIPVVCKTCKLNFCLAHRFEQDHDCEGFVHPLARQQQQQQRHQQQQQQQPSSSRQIEEDEMLARALQASLQDTGGGGAGRSQLSRQNSEGCILQ